MIVPVGELGAGLRRVGDDADRRPSRPRRAAAPAGSPGPTGSGHSDRAARRSRGRGRRRGPPRGWSARDRPARGTDRAVRCRRAALEVAASRRRRSKLAEQAPAIVERGDVHAAQRQVLRPASRRDVDRRTPRSRCRGSSAASCGTAHGMLTYCGKASGCGPRSRLAIMPKSGCSLLAVEVGSSTVGCLPVSDRDGAVVVDVDRVMQRADQRELVGDPGVQRQVLADRHARHARGDRAKDAAHLLRAVGLEVVGFEMAGAAETVDEDDRRVRVCVRAAARPASTSVKPSPPMASCRHAGNRAG